MLRVILCTLLLLNASASFADYNMTPVDRKYTKVVERCVIETMPKTLNQGGLPICYAAAATLLGDEYNCFRKGNKNCTEVPDERRASMLDMSRFSEYIKDQDDKRDRSEYKGLKQGGSIHKTLDSLWYADMVAPKSCVSDTAHFIGGFDPQNTTASDVDRMGQMWNEMAEFHKKLKGAPISLREAEGLKKAYQMQQQATTIELAFAEKTWPLVLDKLLIPEICRDWMDGPEHISYVRNDHPKTFPGWDDDAKPVKSDYKNTVAMARQIICEKKRPIGTSFCAAKPMSYETLKDCSDKQLGHAVVIEGYARVCTTNSADCVDSVKVRNSWGDNWQKQNNDGWIDAKTLLDSTFYSPDALVWMEEKPKEQY